MTMTLDSLKEYYAALLITQYRMKPRAIATIKLLINQAWCDGLPIDLRDCFNLDTAIGAQLDILGRIVGVPRNIFGLDLEHTFMEFSTYAGGSILGWGRYSSSPYPSQLWLRYNSSATYTLSDDEMRALIKLKVIYNTNPMTMKALKEALYAAFAGLIDIEDNQDMTMEYTVQSPYINVMAVADYINVVPKPMGVAATITNI